MTSSGGKVHRRRYRKAAIGYGGEVFRYDHEWVDHWLDDIPPRLVASTWRLTEKGIRRWCARELWRRTRPNFRGWKVAGHE